jgi:hypothetical protein
MIDLFTSQADPSLFQANFLTLLKNKEAETRKVVRQWTDGFVDRDNNISIEFQTKFNPQLWELYLNALFREAGFSLDFAHTAPDFLLTLAGDMIIAEATIMNQANGYAPEWESAHVELPDQEDLVRHASIRMLNAISAKVKKYRESYATLNHVKGHPFILCIGAFEQPYFYKQRDQALRRVLYGDDGVLTLKHKDQTLVVGTAKKTKEVKDNLSPLEFGVFTRADFPEVSAILFSSLANLDKARALGRRQGRVVEGVRRYENGARFESFWIKSQKYRESLANGVHLCLNPFATHPIDPEPFRAIGAAVHRYNPSNGAYAMFSEDGFLEERWVREHEDSEKPVAVTKLGTPPIPGYAEKQLMPHEGSSWLSADDHLAYYRGWTAHMSRMGEDWCSQALKIQVKSVQAFIDANQEEVHDTILPKCGFKTLQKAADRVFDQIDRDDFYTMAQIYELAKQQSEAPE